MTYESQIYAKRHIQRSDSLSLAFFIPFPLSFGSNQLYFFFVSFDKSKQINTYSMIPPSFLHKGWYIVHTLLQFVFCHLTIYPGNYSDSIHRDKLHFFFTVAWTPLCTCAMVYFGQSPIFEHLSTFQYFAIIQKWSNKNLVHIVGSVFSMQSPRDVIAGPKT